MIPAHPLALSPRRTLDERRQIALTRYYLDSGVGGLAVGVHTTQFAIRNHGLLRPVLELAAETATTWQRPFRHPVVLIAGIRGDTRQALDEARLAASLGYHVGLVSLGEMPHASDAQLVAHCRRISEVLPTMGFYLQQAVGGRPLGERFWRELAEIPGLAAIKIAPFNRYATLDVIRAVARSGRTDIALYTGNDDSILTDLVTRVPCEAGGRVVELRMVGGLLGQWAVWTRRAVQLLDRIRHAGPAGPRGWTTIAAALTDANSAIFDSANNYAGCIPGIHEVLRRQGLLRGTWCLDPQEVLSPGQSRQIDRVLRTHPHLTDDDFVREGLDRWLS